MELYILLELVDFDFDESLICKTKLFIGQNSSAW